ncbi:MAG: hypothetical protein JWO30_4697 [Fibrobacteres bacterium]|nr:hypothetical protein [Fibrobacterota bacterium]
MDGKVKPDEDDDSEGEKESSLPEATVTLTLIAVLAATYLWWYWRHRTEILKEHDIHLSFVLAPDTIPVSMPARFELKVKGPKKKPVAERKIHVVVTPENKAEIISVTGPSGHDSAALSNQAYGLSDSSGNVSVMVRPLESGEYTLAAADSLSASAEGAAVDFIAR